MVDARYTIVLKTLLDDPEAKAKIDEALSKYPLHLPINPKKFTEIPSREEINQKLLNHYKYREIGFETFGRFIDELEIAMDEIMPYYNQLFNSEDIINSIEDIFGNLDVVESFEETIEGTHTDDTDTTENENTSNSSNEKTNGTHTSTNTASENTTNKTDMVNHTKMVESDTPQTELSISAEDIDDVKYASKMNLNKNDSESNSTSTGTTNASGSSTDIVNVENTIEGERDLTGSVKNTGSKSETRSNTLTRKGNQGVNTYAHDMLEFRQLFLNIVEMIIEDTKIKELFMQIY